MERLDPLRTVAWVILTFALVALPVSVMFARAATEERAGTILTIGGIIAGGGVALSLLLLAIRLPAPRTQERRPCPFCAELILPEAIICPFCRSEVMRDGPTFGERFRR